MNSERNLPVYLHYEEDGTVFARCPLRPEIQCRSATRALALGTIQQLLRRMPKVPSQGSEKYEVVFLAVAASRDGTARDASRRPTHRVPRARRDAHS